MLRKQLFLVLAIVLMPFLNFAQFGFDFNDSILVIRGADTLKNPWGGGLNYPQFSDFDYDFDGDLDLFIFDRSNDNIRVYTQEGTTEKYYKLAYNAHENFPDGMRYRAALIDYDGDGKKDLFTSHLGGIKVYRNVGDILNGLQWELVKETVLSDYPNTGISALGVSSGDIPAIVDVDNDGDLDVLTFNNLGNRVEYHQNQSMDLYGTADSLIFEMKNECWGKFTENDNNNDIVLNNPNSPCVGGNIANPERVQDGSSSLIPGQKAAKHVGSSLLALDIDSSGVLDLLIGDASYSSLNLLINGGSAVNTDSPMISVEYNFPQNSTPIKITLFPASFFIDVDFDGVKDLVAAPNALNISFNESSVKFYKNIGTNGNPIFVFTMSNLFQNEMIEHGTGSIPMLFDVDEDGLDDLIIGNNFRFKPVDSKESSIAYYRNVGTPTQPAYQYIDYNYLDLSMENFGLRSVPAFGDLDDDGDEDLILGLENGTLVYYENQSVGAGAVWGAPMPNYPDNTGSPIVAGQYIHPTLFDLNEDGLLDLILGIKTGELKYYENVGTVNSPSFELMNANLGNVDVSGSFPDGYAAPQFIKNDGQIHLFVGNLKGTLIYYDSIQNNLGTGNSFNLKYTKYLGIDVGAYSSFHVEDIDGDGNLNMFVGQDLGGVFHFEADSASNVSLSELTITSNVVVYPNPVNETLVISSSSAIDHYMVSDINGRILFQEKASATKETIDVRQLPQGLYIVFIELENGVRVSKKVLKQ